MVKRIQRVSGAIEFFTNENISLQTIVDVNMLTDGMILRLSNTHATNTITCTLPTGQTMNGQASFTIIAGKILELELIGSVWIDTNTDYYSTTEQIVGKWIDGKPLYRKVINFGTLPNNTTKNVAHGISNVDKTTRLYGTAVSPNYTLTLPNAGTSPEDMITLGRGPSNIDITTCINRTNYMAIVVIEYTKTTD